MTDTNPITTCPRCKFELGRLGCKSIICPDCWEDMALEVGHDRTRAKKMRDNQAKHIEELREENENVRQEKG